MHAHNVTVIHTAMEMDKEQGSGSLEMENGHGSGSLSQSVQIVIISVAVCMISSSLVFAVGLLCHRYRYCPKQKQLHELENTQQHRETECVAIEQVELTENVAYSQVQLRSLP
jgi:hypothetical protein